MRGWEQRGFLIKLMEFPYIVWLFTFMKCKYDALARIHRPFDVATALIKIWISKVSILIDVFACCAFAAILFVLLRKLFHQRF